VTPRSGLPAVKSPSAASMRGLGLFGILIPKETARRPLFYRRESCSGDVGDQFRWTASATTQSSETRALEATSIKAAFGAISRDFF
jgi:hypothetical protein